MKLMLKGGIVLSVAISSIAIATEPQIHCKDIYYSNYEVIIQKGKDLSKKQIKALPENIKRKISGNERVSNYNMIIFRNESTPQTVKAIGAEADVLLQVYSLSGSEEVTTYLDELGPEDTSSTLIVDGKELDMSCSVI
jgi:hypothetical protein